MTLLHSTQCFKNCIFETDHFLGPKFNFNSLESCFELIFRFGFVFTPGPCSTKDIGFGLCIYTP